jgi:dihydrofolate reductase|tara:strand:+ start:7591 stop:8070 length:480 start_codon:yes stop_codon:yes gene_type:complete
MEIVLIAAVDINLAIGKEGKIPWDIKEDLKFFRQNTENTAIVMGRATYDSIGRPLPNRKNIVMTRSIQGRDGVVEVSSSQEAINEARSYSEKVNIIGGEYIYKEFLPLATKLLITEIELEVDSADAFFPKWDSNIWKEISRQKSSENGINFSFVEYVKA